MPTLDDLHLAMGEFLTENYVGREHDCWRLPLLVKMIAPWVTSSLSSWVKHSGRRLTPSMQGAGPATSLTRIGRSSMMWRSELAGLLLKRNLIVHGTTYQLGKDSTPPQPYRIGMTKAGAFLNEAVADLDASHVFTVHRIKELYREVCGCESKTRHRYERGYDGAGRKEVSNGPSSPTAAPILAPGRGRGYISAMPRRTTRERHPRQARQADKAPLARRPVCAPRAKSSLGKQEF